MIITFTKLSARCVVALVLAAALGCSRSSDQTAPPAKAADPQAATRQAAGDLLGVLKLIRQEYANAVAPPGGTVIDATEYSETELFAEQAAAKLAALRAAGGLGDATRAERLTSAVTALRDGVAQKAPQATVVGAAASAIAIVEESLAGAVPESIRGAVLATTRADQAIGAEEISGDYRIGLVSGPGRAIFH